MGGPDLSGALYQKGLAILQPPSPDWDRGVSLHQQGFLAYQRGQYATARQHLKASLAILKAVDDLVYVTRSEVGLGMLAYDLGDYIEAETLLRQSLTPLKTQGEHRYRSYALGYLGKISLHQGQPNLGEVKEMLVQSLAISREIKNRAAVAHILLNLAGLLHLTGQPLEAQQLLQESATSQRKLNDFWGLALALLQLGQVSSTLNEGQIAAQHFHEALTIAAKQQFDPLILEILVNLAELRLKATFVPAEQQQVVTFLALAQCHPAAPYPIRKQAARLLAELAAEPAPELAVTTPEQQLKAVVTDLLLT
jgi:tetratricopeptide (TPR) repeat protein